MIMAGGGGTRLWPRSRQRRPKQFLALTGDRSLIQIALDRFEAQVPPARTWVITAAAHVDETRRQLPAVPASQIVGEPMGRNTAPCVGLGAALIVRRDPEAVMLVTPADHVIEPVQEFRRAVGVAAQLAEEHSVALVTFGIPPTYPATGYGYIERSGEPIQRQGLNAFRVQKFEEKPNAETAERFVNAGAFYWNSGLFVWKAKTILAALHRQRPDIAGAAERIADAWDTPERDTVLRREYEAVKGTSIDYAVMQDYPERLVVQAPFRWDDVGSWLALERMSPQDIDGNTIQGTHLGLKTRRCIIVGEPGQLIATVNVEDLLIVRDGDAVLVARRDDAESVGKLVQLLREKGLENHL
jgi:mannose-1-phosphate guanylyltransferase